MDEHKVLDYALVVMKNLNLIIILYMVILLSVRIRAGEFGAGFFVEN